MEKLIKLSEWAKLNSYTYRGAFNLFQQGLIEGAKQLATGTILIDIGEKSREKKKEYVVVYARVSSSVNKPNLESQAERMVQFCNAKGWQVDEVVRECASGLNDKRPKLNKIFAERKATKIVVEHKDRLTRFGFNFITTLLTDCEIVVVNNTESDKADLMSDFISLVTCFSARIYGLRRSRRKTEEIIKNLEIKL